MVRPPKTKKRKGSGQIQWLGLAQRLAFATLPYVLSLAAVGALFGGVAAYALGSPTFGLKEVRLLNAASVTQAQAFAFCELKPGENLISLDLVNVQQVIKRKHPEFKEVRVRRVLPNRVEVILKRRTPVAQVAFSSRYVQIDRDLVLLPGSSQSPFRNLTIIEGSPAPRRGLYVGVTVDHPLTKKAVRLADVIRSTDVLRGHALTKIDISDPKNVAFWIDHEIEIRIGSSHFSERLKLLDQTLKTVGLDKSKIRYIDLRFDDVVIGPR